MLVVFLVADRRFAVELERVQRVLRMVAVTPLPKAPDVILGVFDLHGELLPVASLRRRFRYSDRAVQSTDRLIVVKTQRRRIALAVDDVVGVQAIDYATISQADQLVPGLEYLHGIARLPEIVLLHDVDALLSLDEETRTTAALADLSR